jgi:lipopolysaccharide export system permease protein
MLGFKTIDRYLIKELFWPYLFGMIGFIVVIAIDPLIHAMKNIINQQVDVGVVLKWFFFSLTNDMIFTFPMAILLSTLLVFGRFSNDSEIVALKAGGVSFWRMMYPVMIFAFLSTIVAFLFGEYIMPYSVKEADRIKQEDIHKILPVRGAENVFIKDTDTRTVYAGKVIHYPGQNISVRLENIVITDYHPTNLLPIKRIMAKGAAYMQEKWTFWDGMVYEYDEELNSTLKEEFKRQVIDLDEKPQDFKKEKSRYGKMSMYDLKKWIRYHNRKGFHDVMVLLVEFYMKTSIPFACLIFGMIGAALGTAHSRAGAFIGFGISVMIIFIYYVILSIFKSYGKNGVIPPLLAAWGPNGIFLLVAIWLIIKVRD